MCRAGFGVVSSFCMTLSLGRTLQVCNMASDRHRYSVRLKLGFTMRQSMKFEDHSLSYHCM